MAGERITVPVFLVPMLSSAKFDDFSDDDIRGVLRKLDGPAVRRLVAFTDRVSRLGRELS